MYEKILKTDANGAPVIDGQGQPVFDSRVKLDFEGRPVCIRANQFDDHARAPAKDPTSGKPILDSTGFPLRNCFVRSVTDCRLCVTALPDLCLGRSYAVRALSMLSELVADDSQGSLSELVADDSQVVCNEMIHKTP